METMKSRRRPVFLLCALALVAALRADVSLPRILGANMVLQRGVPVPIWGRAAPGETVTVRFAGQDKRIEADAGGHWQVTLDALPASADPREMTVAGANVIRLANILVGEVWLCSGQSNMEYATGAAKPWAPPATASDPQLAEELKTQVFPTLRLFLVEKQREPPDVVTTGWHEAAGDARAQFSAVGYCFARRLQQELNVPVGMIESAWGGSRIEEWTPAGAYAGLKTVFAGGGEASFETEAVWIGRNYEPMVQPLAPFALRGVLWYQGESNLIAYNDGLRYADKMRVLVDAWRAAWHQPDLPFYCVQIAPFLYSQRQDRLAHAPDELPKLWEAQAAALRIPHTGMVATTDLVDDVSNIHPGRKRIVAARLAALALSTTYGRKGLAWQGPSLARLEIRDAEAIVHFANADGGLASRDGSPLTDFEIAGADGRFVPAAAVIRGDTVVVSSPPVPAPVAVRFGWREDARPNLMNHAGLPAYPFRTDGPVWQPVAP
jgi:sialate O-acetylesterase